MLRVIILSVSMLNAVMLSVLAPKLLSQKVLLCQPLKLHKEMTLKKIYIGYIFSIWVSPSLPLSPSLTLSRVNITLTRFVCATRTSHLHAIS